MLLIVNPFSILNVIRKESCQKDMNISTNMMNFCAKESNAEKRMQLRQEANEKIADMVKKETQDTLNKVLYELSNQMKNAYSRSDA